VETIVHVIIVAINVCLVAVLVAHEPRDLAFPQVVCWWVVLTVVTITGGFSVYSLVRLLW